MWLPSTFASMKMHFHSDVIPARSSSRRVIFDMHETPFEVAPHRFDSI